MCDIFDTIEDRARECAVSKLLWQKNDEIFNAIDIQTFKNIFASKNRSLTIILSDALVKIGRRMREERIELLKEYHIDVLTQTHFSPTKTSKEIMKKYHWRGINRDAIRFAKNCTVCKMQCGEIITIAQANFSS